MYVKTESFTPSAGAGCAVWVCVLCVVVWYVLLQFKVTFLSWVHLSL